MFWGLFLFVMEVFLVLVGGGVFKENFWLVFFLGLCLNEKFLKGFVVLCVVMMGFIVEDMDGMLLLILMILCSFFLDMWLLFEMFFLGFSMCLVWIFMLVFLF